MPNKVAKRKRIIMESSSSEDEIPKQALRSSQRRKPPPRKRSTLHTSVDARKKTRNGSYQEEEDDADADIDRASAELKLRNVKLPIGISSPQELKWFLYTETKRYYPCRICDPDERFEIGLMDCSWDEEEVTVIQALEYPATKPFPGNSDKILAERSALKEYGTSTQWNSTIWKRYIKQRKEEAKKKFKALSESDILAASMYMNRILQAATKSEQDAKAEKYSGDEGSDLDEEPYDLNAGKKSSLGDGMPPPPALIFSERNRERLRPGDVVTYCSPIFCAGDKRGERKAKVIATDPKGDPMIQLSNNEILTNDTRIKRVQVLTKGQLYTHRGSMRAICDFAMKKCKLDNINARTIIEAQARNIGDIIDQNAKKNNMGHVGFLTSRRKQAELAKQAAAAPQPGKDDTSSYDSDSSADVKVTSKKTRPRNRSDICSDEESPPTYSDLSRPKTSVTESKTQSKRGSKNLDAVTRKEGDHCDIDSSLSPPLRNRGGTGRSRSAMIPAKTTAPFSFAKTAVPPKRSQTAGDDSDSDSSLEQNRKLIVEPSSKGSNLSATRKSRATTREKSKPTQIARTTATMPLSRTPADKASAKPAFGSGKKSVPTQQSMMGGNSSDSDSSLFKNKGLPRPSSKGSKLSQGTNVKMEKRSSKLSRMAETKATPTSSRRSTNAASKQQDRNESNDSDESSIEDMNPLRPAKPATSLRSLKSIPIDQKSERIVRPKDRRLLPENIESSWGRNERPPSSHLATGTKAASLPASDAVTNNQPSQPKPRKSGKKRRGISVERMHNRRERRGPYKVDEDDDIEDSSVEESHRTPTTTGSYHPVAIFSGGSARKKRRTEGPKVPTSSKRRKQHGEGRPFGVALTTGSPSSDEMDCQLASQIQPSSKALNGPSDEPQRKGSRKPVAVPFAFGSTSKPQRTDARKPISQMQPSPKALHGTSDELQRKEARKLASPTSSPNSLDDDSKAAPLAFGSTSKPQRKDALSSRKTRKDVSGSSSNSKIPKDPHSTATSSANKRVSKVTVKKGSKTRSVEVLSSEDDDDEVAKGRLKENCGHDNVTKVTIGTTARTMDSGKGDVPNWFTSPSKANKKGYGRKLNGSSSKRTRPPSHISIG